MNCPSCGCELAEEVENVDCRVDGHFAHERYVGKVVTGTATGDLGGGTEDAA